MYSVKKAIKDDGIAIKTELKFLLESMTVYERKLFFEESPDSFKLILLKKFGKFFKHIV